MKLLTLNTHSLQEKNAEQKRTIFVQTVLRVQPDVMALQEVNQNRSAEALATPPQAVQCLKEDILLRSDNHAVTVQQELADAGLSYYAVWLPMKVGYDRYDEGVALFSRLPILETKVIRMSEADNYFWWKTRFALGIRTEQGWSFSVHMGWWDDPEEPFAQQWERLERALPRHERVWLMGDFNSSSDQRGQGYDCVLTHGWKDTYKLAWERDNGFTVEQVIDGWEGKEPKQMRIDYVFVRPTLSVKRSTVIFNGRNEPVVSDHYGILVETERKEDL